MIFIFTMRLLLNLSLLFGLVFNQVLSRGGPTVEHLSTKWPSGKYNNPRKKSFEQKSSYREADAVQYERLSPRDFLTRSSRQGFIRRVYAIFGSQMLVTALFTGLISTSPAIKFALLKNYRAISLASFIGSSAVVLALCGNPTLRYKWPTNIMLLGVHTMLQSLMVGTFASLFNPRTVFLGGMHTLSVLAAITAYSFQSNPAYDLTVIGNTLFAALVSLTIGSLLNLFFKMPLFDNILSGAMAVLFGVYIAHDTQKIVGGKHHKHAYSQNEYILAALNLYQDVLNLFVQIMKILNKLEKNRGEEDS